MVFLKHLLFLSLLSSLSHSLDINTLHQAVNIAGKQRMFTQRMLKDYAMLGMGNSFNNPKKDLEEIIIKFENHLELLFECIKNKKIEEEIRGIKVLWKPIKKVLESPPKKELVIHLQESLEKLLQKSDKVTHLFAKETGEESGIIIDVSGRQRMLSQRMASLYMLKVWGVEHKNFHDKMEKSMKLFETSLIKLQASKLNTEEINTLLKEVEKSFSFFKIMNQTSDTFIPTLIYKKSNDILKNMDTITEKYVQLKKIQE